MHGIVKPAERFSSFMLIHPSLSEKCHLVDISLYWRASFVASYFSRLQFNMDIWWIIKPKLIFSSYYKLRANSCCSTWWSLPRKQRFFIQAWIPSPLSSIPQWQSARHHRDISAFLIPKSSPALLRKRSCGRVRSDKSGRHEIGGM